MKKPQFIIALIFAVAVVCVCTLVIVKKDDPFILRIRCNIAAARYGKKVAEITRPADTVILTVRNRRYPAFSRCITSAFNSVHLQLVESFAIVTYSMVMDSGGAVQCRFMSGSNTLCTMKFYDPSIVNLNIGDGYEESCQGVVSRPTVEALFKLLHYHGLQESNYWSGVGTAKWNAMWNQGRE